MRFVNRIAVSCLLLLCLAAGPGGAQLLMPRLLRQFDEKAGLSLTTLGIVQDAQGRLWMASTNGIVCFDGRQFRVFHDPALKEGDYYYHLAPSPDGRIWLKRGWGYSLSYIDTHQPRLVRIPDTTRLVRDYLARDGSHYLFVDTQANLWIGLQKHGLLKVNPRNLAVEHIVDRGLDVRFITQDRRGTVYFTTGNQGFFAYNPQTRELTNYRHIDKDTTSLSSNATFGVQARPDGSILLGLDNGVNLFRPATGQFRNLGLNAPRTPDSQDQSYSREFKLDAQGNAYFSRGRIIYRYTAQGVLQQVGTRSPTHSISSLHITPTNRLWISSLDKLYEYDLNQVRIVPSLLFLKLTINGTELRDNTSATQNLVYDDQGHPTLTVRENDPFAMQFTLSAKLGPQTLRWRLNGYNQEWTSSQDIQGEAAYQLPAGTYTFIVNRGSRIRGWEPNTSTLTIVVVAPFWKTPGFLALMGLVVGGLGYHLIRTYRRRRQLAWQLVREQQEAASLRQLDELKTRFFSNVTHEFRTPLTIILNATEQLTAKAPDPNELPEVATIQRHAHQLLRLITETLDMARLDAGKLETYSQLGNPVWFIGQVVAQFAGLATQRGIDLTYNTHPFPAAGDPLQGTSPDEGLFGFDGDKWEKIAYNLLSNALKFTPSGGRVQVTGHITADNHFVLGVTDTGIGIPEDQVDRIFERFHQVDARSTRTYSGTGIGLALVRELTTWLSGRVAVESRIDQGSTFTVELPLTVPDKNHSALPTGTTLVDAARLDTASATSMNQPAPKLINKRKYNGTAVDTGATPKPLVLVVEDNEDLRAQVVDYLSGTYQVLSAENGRLGWEQALAQVPELIVSDVMMPELDGYELLERLKNDERTSHIPVILLTARSARESRMQGLQNGADDYLVKPFSLAELVLRVGNGLRTRQNWQKRFLNQPPPTTLPLERVADREEAFLNRLRQSVLAQLDVESIDVDWLATQANMSRTQLNRKLSALTSLSPNRFIQRVRLERAAELLQTGEMNVTEVAYQIGYNSPSHFAKVFQDHFGYAPSKLKDPL
ncbi:ATP-binding protein [Spirosoma soli]